VHGLGGYLVALACIFGVNLLPAFGPPTWSLLVFFRLNSDIAPVPLVIGGALAAAAGRLVLAYGSRRLRGRFSAERLENLEAAKELLAGDRKRAVGGLALFALSPVPSAQLFIAAGLLDVALLPLTAAFFTGRLVSYSIYVTGASLAKESFGEALTGALTSPWGIALQVVMLGGLVALMKIDWVKVLRRSRRRPPGPPARPAAPSGRPG
jgi:membrane protein YqaA with SNARE-associated domain